MKEQEWVDVYKDICFPKEMVIAYEDDIILGVMTPDTTSKFLALMIENQKDYQLTINTLKGSKHAHETGSLDLSRVKVGKDTPIDFPVLMELRMCWSDKMPEPSMWYWFRLHSGLGVKKLNEKLKEQKK